LGMKPNGTIIQGAMIEWVGHCDVRCLHFSLPKLQILVRFQPSLGYSACSLLWKLFAEQAQKSLVRSTSF